MVEKKGEHQMSMDYGMQECKSEVGMIRRATLRQRIEARLVDAKKTVERSEAVIKLLDENPTFEQIQNAISDLGF